MSAGSARESTPGATKVQKRAETGLVVWEEAAELSGPRSRAFRRASAACDDPQRCGRFLPHHVGISPDGRTSELSGHVCSPRLSPAIPTNASSRAAKADGFST